jgi:hypothetical protein
MKGKIENANATRRQMLPDRPIHAAPEGARTTPTDPAVTLCRESIPVVVVLVIVLHFLCEVRQQGMPGRLSRRIQGSRETLRIAKRKIQAEEHSLAVVLQPLKTVTQLHQRLVSGRGIHAAEVKVLTVPLTPTNPNRILASDRGTPGRPVHHHISIETWLDVFAREGKTQFHRCRNHGLWHGGAFHGYLRLWL